MGLFGKGFREGREQARAARGAPPLQGRPRDAGQDRREPPPPPSWDEPPPPHAPADIDAGRNADLIAELQTALQERDGELTENKRLLAEMADYAEKMEARVVELIAGAEPMARTLRLPGVKTFLFNKFHPDKHPDADARQLALLNEAVKTISAAYALADTLQTQSPE
jgi:hypothetical protein